MDKSNDGGSLLARALDASWQLSASIAAITLMFSFVMLPALGLAPIISSIFVPMAQSFSILVAAFFVMLALAKLLSGVMLKHRERTGLDCSESTAKESNPNVRELFRPSIAPLTDAHETHRQEDEVSLAYRMNSDAFPPIHELWTLDLLKTLDWKRFEDLCSDYFSEIGIKNKQTGLGADGGIDLWLYENNPHQPTAVVQCKQYSTEVGVRLMREFLGVMHHEGISKGYYVTTNQFNRGAIQLAKANHIELMDGKTLISHLKQLPVDSQRSIFDRMTTGDFTTPTCVRCGSKMVQRKSGDRTFWGCKHYPKCRGRMRISARPKAANISRR